jgi:hypothetical protein
MSNTSNEQSAKSFFGDIISTYTRAQAIEDGVLIDVSPIAKESGFNEWPVSMTAGAWADCVAWSDTDSQTQVYQDQSGRLYDVIFMAFQAICLSREVGDRLLFRLYRVPRDGRSTEAELTTLKLIVGPGDSGEPVISILLLDED